jgi:hypothetical protein
VDVHLPEDRELLPDVLARLKSLPPISIYRMLAIVPQSLIPWSDLTSAVYECELDSRVRRLATDTDLAQQRRFRSRARRGSQRPRRYLA